MSYDIFDCYQEIQKIIARINETNSSTKEELMLLIKNFDKMINEIESFLIFSYDYYYGYFLINLKLYYRYENDFVAGVSFSPGFPILMINPITLGSKKLKEIIYILCHEIEHLVLSHHAEILKMNKDKSEKMRYKLNLAFDAAVNDRLNLTIQNGFDLLEEPEGIITSKVIGSMIGKTVLPNQHYLYYYNLLKDRKIDDENSSENTIFDDINYEIKFGDDDNNNNNAQNGDARNRDDNENSSNPSNSSIPNNLNNLSSSYNSLSSSSPASFDDMSYMDSSNFDFETIEEIIGNYISKTMESMSEKTRGLFSSDFAETISKIKKKPVVSWKKELRKFLGNIPYGHAKTIMRLNRRQPNRIDLRGTTTNKIIKLIIAIDTSASMSSSLLEEVLNEIAKIVKARKTEITVIECDTSIKKVYVVKKIKDIQYNVKGRGGTWFSPVINYINKNKKYRDGLLIYFTDGYGEWEIPKPLIHRMLWIVYGDELSVNKSYGSIIYIDEEKGKIIRRVHG